MNELWVARDIHGPIHLYEGKPVYSGGLWFSEAESRGFCGSLRDDAFPNLRPGECKRLVFAEEQ